MTSSIETSIQVFLLISARVSAMVMTAPLFGHAAIPARIKAPLAFAIALLIYPVVPSKAVVGTGAVTMRLLLELATGALIGIVTSLVFDGVQLAGHIASGQIGFSIVNMIDPQTNVDTTVMGVLHQLIAILIFLQMDVHHWIIRALTKSFLYLPAGVVLTGSSINELLKSANAIWMVGIQIAAPVLIATMITDLVLGFLAKASPQFPALLFGISLKSVLGMLVLAAAIRYWPMLLERYFHAAISNTERVLRLTT